MNIECQVPNCTVGSFSKGESFRRICQKHFNLLLNYPEFTKSEDHIKEVFEINKFEDIQENVEYPCSVLKKALKLCLAEISKISQELQNQRESTQSAVATDQPGNSEQEVISCTICAKKFSHKYRMNFHMKTVHGSTRKFMCYHCGTTFKRLDGLRVHEMKSHKSCGSTTEKPTFQCGYCSKFLSTKRNLRGHLKSFHTGERSHLCRSCGKSYATAAALRTHEKFHIKPFSCNICGQSFADSSRFGDHMNGHKEVYLKCNVCSKKYMHRNSFRIHMKLHESGSTKKHKCNYCGTAFSLTSYLRKHIRRCKKKPNDEAAP